MMTRFLLATTLSLTALAPMAEAGANGNPETRNGGELNGLLLTAPGAGAVVAMPGEPLNRRSIGGGDPETGKGVELNGLQWNGWEQRNALALNALEMNGMEERNSLELNALAENGMTDKNAMALNALTDRAAVEAGRRVHAEGFVVTSVVLPDGTVVGW
jgi:hypothetical protein